MRIEEKTARLLKAKNKTISVAESCTGGLLANKLTNIPGSTKYFKLGIVSYSNKSKTKLLKIPQNHFKKYGAVSKEIARQMAIGVRKIQKSYFGVGITGIAGPSGGTKVKPVGLVFIAVSTNRRTLCEKYLFRGTRLQIKNKAANQALQLLLKLL